LIEVTSAALADCGFIAIMCGDMKFWKETIYADDARFPELTSLFNLSPRGVNDQDAYVPEFLRLSVVSQHEETNEMSTPESLHLSKILDQFKRELIQMHQQAQ